MTAPMEKEGEQEMCGGFSILMTILTGVLAVRIGAGWRRRAMRSGLGGCYGIGAHWGRFGCGAYEHPRAPRDGASRWNDDRPPFGMGARLGLRWLFEQLDTTPGQEKVIKEAASGVMAALRTAREELLSTRGRLADALRGESFDHEAIADAWVKHDKSLEETRLRLVTALQHVHEALDDTQRRQLAEMIEEGLSRFGRA